jgi:CHAT domain-containing protein
MSLWKVDDLSTETLMKNFYKHWLDYGMSKHDALWQAKLDLRNDKSHPEWAKPYYWGAFVLIGQ